MHPTWKTIKSAAMHLPLLVLFTQKAFKSLAKSLPSLVQPTWKAIKSAAVNLPGGDEVQLEDVQLMADLCPDVVVLRDPQQ